MATLIGIGAVDEHGNFRRSRTKFSPSCCAGSRAQRLAGRRDARLQHDVDARPHRCASYGQPLYEHGIGFKYVCDLMLNDDILIGGEESGGIGYRRHLPERDGLLNACCSPT